MEKSEDTVYESYILKNTAKPYDGVDYIFDYCVRVINYYLYSNPKVPRSQEGIFYERSRVVQGEPLFHIISLSILCISSLSDDEITETKKSNLTLLLPYMIRWIECQNEKLTLSLESPRKKVETQDLSEFHLSQEFFDKSKDSLITHLALDKMVEAISLVHVKIPDCEYLYDFGNAFYKLQKLLAISYQNTPPSLSKKKNMPVHLNVLSVMKYESSAAILNSLIRQGKYLAAEVYANKCLSTRNKLHYTDKVLAVGQIAAYQAIIAVETNNIEMLLESLDKVINQVKGNYDSQLKLEKLTRLARSCEYAGAYFEKTNEIDKAIKYYIEAENFAITSENKLRYIDKLKH